MSSHECLPISSKTVPYLLSTKLRSFPLKQGQALMFLLSPSKHKWLFHIYREQLLFTLNLDLQWLISFAYCIKLWKSSLYKWKYKIAFNIIFSSCYLAACYLFVVLYRMCYDIIADFYTLVPNNVLGIPGHIGTQINLLNIYWIIYLWLYYKMTRRALIMSFFYKRKRNKTAFTLQILSTFKGILLIELLSYYLPKSEISWEDFFTREIMYMMMVFDIY